jgi:hypothetical protein
VTSRSRAFLEEAVTWHRLNHVAIELDGIELKPIGPTSGPSKDSVALHLFSPTRIAGVVIWDSGEYEVETALVEGEDDLKVEVGDLANESEVATLLEKIRAILGGRANPSGE